MSDAPATTKPEQPDYLRQARGALMWAVLASVFGLLLLGYALRKENGSLTVVRYLGCGVAAISALFNGWEAAKYFRLHREQQAKTT